MLAKPDLEPEGTRERQGSWPVDVDGRVHPRRRSSIGTTTAAGSAAGCRRRHTRGPPLPQPAGEPLAESGRSHHEAGDHPVVVGPHELEVVDVARGAAVRSDDLVVEQPQRERALPAAGAGGARHCPALVMIISGMAATARPR